MEEDVPRLQKQDRSATLAASVTVQDGGAVVTVEASGRHRPVFDRLVLERTGPGTPVTAGDGTAALMLPAG